MSMTSTAESVLMAIGGTPVVCLRRIVPAASADVLVKLESVNPTGSYKDRMALAMIEGAEARGALRPGMRVVEFTGGSTGSSLALVCAVKGYRFAPVSSDAFAKEKLDTMRAFGADLHVVASEGGKITPKLFDWMRDEVKRLLAEGNTFWTDQFHNTDAIDGYMGIGRELLEQTGRAAELDIPVGRSAARILDVHLKMRVRIDPLDPGDGPGQRHRLRPVVFRRKRMMRQQGNGRKHRRGHNTENRHRTAFHGRASTVSVPRSAKRRDPRR